MSPRLGNIQAANQKSRTRDLLFAGFVALAAVVSIATIGIAVEVATQIAQR